MAIAGWSRRPIVNVSWNGSGRLLGEQVAVVNLRKTLPDRKALPVRNARPVQAGSLWPAGIRRPSRGRGWR